MSLRGYRWHWSSGALSYPCGIFPFVLQAPIPGFLSITVSSQTKSLVISFCFECCPSSRSFCRNRRHDPACAGAGLVVPTAAVLFLPSRCPSTTRSSQFTPGSKALAASKTSAGQCVASPISVLITFSLASLCPFRTLYFMPQNDLKAAGCQCS